MDPDGNGDEYDDTNYSADYDWKQVQAYEEGYCKGYDNGCDKNPRAYVLVEDAPVVLNEGHQAASALYDEAYCLGYKAAKGKKRNCTADYFGPAQKGYMAGFAEAKAKLAPRYS